MSEYKPSEETKGEQEFKAPGFFRVLRVPVMLVAAVSSLLFLGLAVNVALFGTGEALPVGSDVIEGELLFPDNGELQDSPVGAPFLRAGVTFGNPGGGGIVDHRWKNDVGAEVVSLRLLEETEATSRFLEVPDSLSWRGTLETESRTVEFAGNLPIVRDIDLEEGGVNPPFAITVRAIRPGDTVLFVPENGSGTEVQPYETSVLFVGTRDELNAWIAGREQARFPIVLLLFVVGLSAFGLALSLFRQLRQKQREANHKGQAE